MNDDLEQRLAALRPVELPSKLRVRLVAAQPSSKIHWLYAAVPLAAAAVWVLVFTIDRPITPAPPSGGAKPSDLHVFLPIAQTSTLLGVEDLAVFDASPSQPVRLVRATWLDDVTYRGDDGHSTFHHEEPRAEIIPIALETY